MTGPRSVVGSKDLATGMEKTYRTGGPRAKRRPAVWLSHGAAPYVHDGDSGRTLSGVTRPGATARGVHDSLARCAMTPGIVRERDGATTIRPDGDDYER